MFYLQRKVLCRIDLPFQHSTNHHLLNVIHTRQINDVVAVQNNLASQLVHILTNLGMLDHDNDHIDIREEIVKIVVLVLDHILGDKRIIHLYRRRSQR